MSQMMLKYGIMEAKMKIKISELKHKKGNISVDIDNITPNISQTDVEIIATNAVELAVAKGGKDE